MDQPSKPANKSPNNYTSFTQDDLTSGFRGELRYGLKHGQGVFSNKDGSEVYNGNWVMNKRTGIGQ